MSEDADVGRKAFHLQKIIAKFQDSFTVLEKVVARNFITVRCTLVQSAVLRSHVVCLSVRPSVRL